MCGKLGPKLVCHLLHNKIISHQHQRKQISPEHQALHNLHTFCGLFSQDTSLLGAVDSPVLLRTAWPAWTGTTSIYMLISLCTKYHESVSNRFMQAGESETAFKQAGRLRLAVCTLFPVRAPAHLWSLSKYGCDHIRRLCRVHIRKQVDGVSGARSGDVARQGHCRCWGSLRCSNTRIPPPLRPRCCQGVHGNCVRRDTAC